MRVLIVRVLIVRADRAVHAVEQSALVRDVEHVDGVGVLLCLDYVAHLEV